MARMIITPYNGEGKREVEMMRKRVSRRREVRMRAQVHATAKGPPSPLHPHCQHQEPLQDPRRH